MNLFTQEDLEALVREHEKPCISIFTPLHRGGTATETQENQTRLKNRLQEAEQHLREMELRQKEIDELLEGARTILQNAPFWKQDSDGLAIFTSPDMFRYYRLPRSFQELVVVSDEFHVKPLIPLLTDDGRFYVLALSQNNVRLFQCTRRNLREAELSDTPASLEEFLQYDVPEKQLQLHAGAPDGAGGYHGQGDIPDKALHKRKVSLFVRQVQKGVHRLVGGEDTPVVLAGVKEMCSLYREANRNDNLMDEYIEGNPDRLRPEELHSSAWEIVEPHFQKEQERAVELFNSMAGSHRASDDLEEVIPAAYAGRVDILLVDLDHQYWGTYDPQTDTIHYHDEEEAGDEDLIDVAAVQTLLNGGTVYALHSDELPGDDGLAAVFRY